MTDVPNRSSKNRRQVFIFVTICSFVMLLICGLLWRYWFGPRRMFVAIAREDTAQAQNLMRFGVSPDADVFLIGGLMHTAAARGQIQMMEILYRSGANINRIDGWGDTPAHEAAECNQLAAFRWLIAHGADLSHTNRHGLTVAQCVTNRVPDAEQEQFLSVIRSRSSGSVNSKD